MKLYCLSSHPNKPCSVLKFKNTTIMFDCGLDMTPVLMFLPLPLVHSSRLRNLPSWIPRNTSDAQLEGELKECAGRVFVDSCPEFHPPEAGIVDFSEVDVILISNYQSMMALPFITEHTGFKGSVYATDPTLQIGKQCMDELITYIERTPKIRLASRWKQTNILKNLPPPLCESIKTKSWKQVYTAKEVSSSLSKVQIVGFSEELDVYGELCVSAVSSGYCLGSCNWIVWSDHEKVSYISASSTLTTHPRPMERDALKNSDLIILNSLTQAPLANPDNMMEEICVTVSMTVRNGGNVLIPCYPSGVTFDLFECLSTQMDGLANGTVPMYFLSPVADHSLAYSNILADWLSLTKQSKVYTPEEPFPHAHLVRSARLKAFSSLKDENFSNEFRTPCVVFAGHPSLRFGDCVHFMELWGGSANNAIIFTEPDFPYIEAVAPYQPLAMKVVYYPIDTSLSFSQANKVIRESKPVNLLLPEQYTVPSPLYRHRTDLTIEAECNTMPFKYGDIIQIPINRTEARLMADSEFTASVQQIEVKPGSYLTTTLGAFKSKDNRCFLKCIPEEIKEEGGPPKKKAKIGYPSSNFWGALDVPVLIQKLNKAGLVDVKVEKSPTGFIIELQNEEILVRVDDHSTHLVSPSGCQLVSKLSKLILEALNKF